MLLHFRCVSFNAGQPVIAVLLCVLLSFAAGSSAMELNFEKVLAQALSHPLKAATELRLNEAPALADALREKLRAGDESLLESFSYEPKTRTMALQFTRLPNEVFVLRWNGAMTMQVLQHQNYSERLGSLDRGADEVRLLNRNWVRLRRTSLSLDRDAAGALVFNSYQAIEFHRVSDWTTLDPEVTITGRALRLKLVRSLSENLYLAKANYETYMIVHYEPGDADVQVVTSLTEPLVVKAVMNSQLIGYVGSPEEAPQALAWRKTDQLGDSLIFYTKIEDENLRVISYRNYRNISKISQSFMALEKVHLLTWHERSQPEALLPRLGRSQGLAKPPAPLAELSRPRPGAPFAVRWADDDTAGLYQVGEPDPLETVELEGPRLRYEISRAVPPITLDLFTGEYRQLVELSSAGIRADQIDCQALLMSRSSPW